jgi:putative nucleotidyltransferase with HDIG domain
MDIPAKYKGKYFYHFTHLENIESILENGLLSTNKKIERKIAHVDLANENIQLRRSEMEVPCEPKGTIHDYVPFYFTSRNPMLLGVLNRKNIDQPLVVYIAVSIEKIVEDNVIFTDASANTTIPPNFYTNPDDLKHLSWDLINSRKWSEKDKNNLHKRMAEVLIMGNMPISWIDAYYVYNEMAKDEIEKLYEKHGIEKPKILYNPLFYYTKFYFEDRSKETLITGPYFMEHYFIKTQKKVKKKREKAENKEYTFENINDAISKIENNFCVIPELNDIFELNTDNKVHTQNVSEHTIQVVENLDKSIYFKDLSGSDKELVKLSAYLHDIGKGPKSKWENEIQQAYPDHPADAVPMIKRILIEEFKEISEYEIRVICLLVFYHDLIGDILERGRSEKELLKLNINENELNMLIAITLADVRAINSGWLMNLQLKLPNFVARIKKEIN